MGAGRKTFTYDHDTRNESNYRFEQQQKNLGNQLGGVIFMCNTRTYHTCMDHMLFGLPGPHWCYVQHIRIGMPLFLYNFETKELHGIFRAASDGDWEIDPLAWTDGTRRTPYPCQVSVEVYLECPPAPLEQFRGLIAENYVNGDKFQQELSKKQAAELCALFRRKREGQGYTTAAPDDWPGLGAGSSRGSGGATAAQFVPSGAQPASPWAGRGAAAGSYGGLVAMEAEPSGPADLGGKTFAQIQAEEEAKAKKAAKLAAKQAAATKPPPQQQQQQRPLPANGGNVSAAATAAGPSRPVQQAQQAEARSVAAQTQQQQQQQQPAAVVGTQAGASVAAKPGVEQLSDELTALKQTLNPLIAGMLSTQVDSQMRTATALRDHLSRLDDHLMKVQKERGQAMREIQALKEERAALQHSVSAATAATQAPTGQPREEIYLLGGNDNTSEAAAADGGWLKSVLIYSPADGSWRQGPDMPLPRGYGCSAVLNGSLYVIGGGNQSEWLADCRRLDLRGGGWHKLPALSALRGCAGAAPLGGRLYVAGGGTADDQYNSVEIFNPEINAWMPGPPLHFKRFSTAAAPLGGCVYVVGGYDGSYLQSVERLDPREGKWQLVADMKEKRGAHACAADPAAGLLYVVGGYDVNHPTTEFMPAVEAYDPRANRWAPRAPMALGRAYGSAACAAGALWAVGGMKGDLYNGTMERYDSGADRWTTVALPPGVSTQRAFLSASVVQAI